MHDRGVIQKGNTAYMWDHGTITISKYRMIETEGHNRWYTSNSYITSMRDVSGLNRDDPRALRTLRSSQFKPDTSGVGVI